LDGPAGLYRRQIRESARRWLWEAIRVLSVTERRNGVITLSYANA
jgi:hypothetical protein